MISYFCIVNMPGVACREIAVFAALNDPAARAEMERLSNRWPGYETIGLYEGERPVSFLANPALGFATEPLAIDEAAA